MAFAFGQNQYSASVKRKMSTREVDQLAERNVATFLDEKIYSDKGKFKSTQRVDTLEEQLAGCDIIVSLNDGVDNHKNIIVDEKMAISRANRKLETFSLELSFKNRRGNIETGWFLDKQKDTDAYMFGWIVSADVDMHKGMYPDKSQLNKNTIKVFDYALVEKSAIHDFIESYGLTRSKLSEIDEQIRDGKVTVEELNDEYIESGVKFFFSTHLAEEPINLLISKEKYKEMALVSGRYDVLSLKKTPKIKM